MKTKNELIDEVNLRLQETTGGQIQIGRTERQAPLLHALLDALLYVINSKEDRRG